MLVFFFNDTATTEIYTLSLHDALPIWGCRPGRSPGTRSSARTSSTRRRAATRAWSGAPRRATSRSEEHTSELQSRQYLVCRLLLEKKKNKSRSCTFYVLNIHAKISTRA